MQKLPFEIEEFSPTFKDEFYSLSKTTTYQKSTTPFSENELKNYMFIVLEGKIKTYRINLENMREQTFFIYKRGDIFDITTILDGKSHDVIYEVLEDAKTLKIPINTVKEWLKNSPEFSQMFYRYISSHIRYLEDLSSDISLFSVKDRLINLLLANLNPDDKLRYNILQNLSNTQIASLLGTVRAVLERAINDLESKEHIKTTRKNIQTTSKFIEKYSKMLPK